MKVRVWLTTGVVFVKEVDHYKPWGDGIQGYDADGRCILAVLPESLAAFEIIDDDRPTTIEKIQVVDPIVFNQFHTIGHVPPIDAVSKHRIETE